MAKLTVRADLPVEAPALTLQGTDDVSDLHGPRVRERCDDLVGAIALTTLPTRFAPWKSAPSKVAGHRTGAPSLPECEPRAVGGGSGDQPGGCAHEGPPCGVLGVRGIYRIATTVAITPATTVASPERSIYPTPKGQRVATTPPPFANPDSLGLFS